MARERVLEYRARDDDAWYSVHVAVKGGTLTIQFQGLQETDELVASNFESEEDIDGVVRRFRQVSPQLQDNECGRVTEGSIVCAACHDSYRDDMRYYDALVEAVSRSFRNSFRLFGAKSVSLRQNHISAYFSTFF